MHFRLILLVTTTCLIGNAFSAATIATKSDFTAAAITAKPQGFSSRLIESNDEDEEFETQAQTNLGYRQRPVYDYGQSEEEQEEPQRQYYQNRNVKQQSNYLKQTKKQSSEELETEEEIEEPDKLSTLLAKSSFNCNSKTTGYYADESVNCDVFHYCQDNQRHSWVCPDGFKFHQIHLICMPPTTENICQQSSKYHIVNDYLYKPLNLQEHQSKPNVTLRYSERYYPESYYETDRYEDEEEPPRQHIHHQRQPIQVGFQAQHYQQPTQQPQLQYQQPRQQPVQQVRHQPVQQQYQPPPPQQTTVYRKPTSTTTARAPVVQPQIQQQRPQTIAPALATPTPYRFFTAAPQQAQQQVYRTPEEINISLQQRRPQFFVATTPRYYEDEYLYERRK